MGLQLLRRAPRQPDGRVAGVAPAQLQPKVLRYLTPEEMRKVWANQEEINAVLRKKAALMASLGLDPRRKVRITSKGEVLEIGNNVARY